MDAVDTDGHADMYDAELNKMTDVMGSLTQLSNTNTNE